MSGCKSFTPHNFILYRGFCARFRGAAPQGDDVAALRGSAKQRSCEGDCLLAALDQDRLMDFIPNLDADWRLVTAPGRLVPRMHESAI